jgi:hypothetical protein
MTIAVSVNSTASPTLARLVAGLSAAGRVQLHEFMGRSASVTVRDHVTVLAGTRHKTATDLGASPSGFLAQAAEKVALGEVTEASATITLRHPGFRRAFEDVTLVPRNARALTIPINPAAYNKTARSMKGLFLAQGKLDSGKTIGLLGKLVNGSVVWMYRLVRSVFQKQDRTLLPDDSELQRAAISGAADYADMLLAATGEPEAAT